MGLLADAAHAQAALRILDSGCVWLGYLDVLQEHLETHLCFSVVGSLMLQRGFRADEQLSLVVPCSAEDSRSSRLRTLVSHLAR